MSWSKKQLKRAKLYLILDAEVLSYTQLLARLKPAVRAGVDIVQLRSKKGSAKDILDFCRRIKKLVSGKALFIVNDRIDLALLSGADGVHLGQEDVPYAQARNLMGKKAVIGVSCQSLEHARKAQEEGADYIGFGSIFKTKTKPGRQPMDPKVLAKVIKEIKIPVFPIGGIGQKNLSRLTRLGVKRAAVCRDILLARDVVKTVGSLKDILRG